MLKKLTLAAAAALAITAAGTASAHTISIGVYNAGAPGSVTLAMGTYDHGGSLFEGAMALIAGPITTGPVSFTSVTTVKPVDLIDGVNNFYADAAGNFGGLAADSFHTATNNLGLGPVANWQELTFTGLTAGTYTYQLSGMNSQNWTNINSFTNNWTGTLEISGAVSGNVPEPGSLALIGLALAGLTAGRRRAV
jgi:fibronectin-binding autotransporter adhesin